jgi:hypothetical protein
MIEIRETARYAAWFRALRDMEAKARIDARIRRMSLVISATWGRWEKASASFAFILARDTGSISRGVDRRS